MITEVFWLVYSLTDGSWRMVFSLVAKQANLRRYDTIRDDNYI